MVDSTVENLRRIGRACVFADGEHICSEGEPGAEMYIVIQGKVRVLISSLLEEPVPVAEAVPGGFFGEMALFDRKPRSATCVAEGDTICIAIGREHLRQFISTCPDIAEKLFISLSSRVREMNDMIYKTAPTAERAELLPFSIPEGHQSAALDEPPGSYRHLGSFQSICPVCGTQILVSPIKASGLGPVKELPSQRRVYPDFDGLWHYIWTCPDCGYSNYYRSFFHTLPESPEFLHHVVMLERSYLQERFPHPTHFDQLVFQYFGAIHFNQCVDPENTLLLGKLWLYLHWLYQDAENEAMQAYTRKQALEYYGLTYRQEGFQLQSEGARQKCAMVLAQLSLEGGDRQSARAYLGEVVKYPGHELSQLAYDTLYDMRSL